MLKLKDKLVHLKTDPTQSIKKNELVLSFGYPVFLRLLNMYFLIDYIRKIGFLSQCFLDEAIVVEGFKWEYFFLF